MNTYSPDQLRKMALRELSHADYRHGRSILERENCAACVLLNEQFAPSKIGAMRHKASGRPNHCAWLITYVQAGLAVPRRWYEAEIEEIERDNPDHYRFGLACIQLFGLRISGRQYSATNLASKGAIAR